MIFVEGSAEVMASVRVSSIDIFHSPPLVGERMRWCGFHLA